MKNFLKRNPPTSAGGFSAAIAFLGASLADWGLEGLPASIPLNVRASLWLVAAGLATVVGGLVGKLAQKWTWPDENVQEMLEQFRQGEEVDPDEFPSFEEEEI